MIVQHGIDAFVGGLGARLTGWLQPGPMAANDFGIGDFVFFKYVLDRLQHDINVFGNQVLGRVMDFVGIVALTVLTLWVLIQGYRLMSGQLRESAMGLVVNTLKAAFIVSLALSFGAANNEVIKYLTVDMQEGIHYLITGNTGMPGEEIDKNLGWMQVALSSMDVLDAGGDLDTNSEKDRAATMVVFGAGGPPVVAGALLLMYQIAMALFVGLGPLFILSLLFESTKSLFQKWLFYGIGTMFSMAVLSAMVTITLKMVSDVAVGMWASDALSTLFPVLGDGEAVSYSSRAMQTGGMGMIITLLLVTVPPMAASFFNGAMGNFAWGSAFGGLATAASSANGIPPGQPGHIPSYAPTMPVQEQRMSATSETGMGDFYAGKTPTYSHGPGGTAANPAQSQSSLGPGARGAVHAQTPSGGTSASSAQQAAPPVGAPPPQSAPPVGTPPGVAGSPPAQTSGPTYTPPPPPKGSNPPRSGS